MFLILNTYLVDDILEEIYVPTKYSQNIFTSVCWDVCSGTDDKEDYILLSYIKIQGLLVPGALLHTYTMPEVMSG